jgi:hypothetical protein
MAFLYAGRLSYFMRKIFCIVALCAALPSLYAQELYVYTEPASNMPSRSVSAKFTTVLGNRMNQGLQQRYMPEVMVGMNRNLMLHAGTAFSNMANASVGWEGAFLYGKYRFLSNDGVHRHFRMAAFGEMAYSRNPMMFDEVSLQGDISGVQAGLIATQLSNKLAVSATTSMIKPFYTYMHHHDDEAMVNSALNYSLSGGYLVFPREYTSFDQLNFNIYTEFLGQRTFGRKTWFVDAAPAIQFIFNSNSKVNLGYRFQLGGNARRSYTESFTLAFEHTFFNVLPKKK